MVQSDDASEPERLFRAGFTLYMVTIIDIYSVKPEPERGLDDGLAQLHPPRNLRRGRRSMSLPTVSSMQTLAQDTE